MPLQFVQELKLGNNLKAMGLKVSLNTETYRIIKSEVGDKKAKEILLIELNKSINKYQKEWDKNLSSAYDEVFKDNELKSILELKQKSPYAKKFIESQRKVGESMQNRSGDLLNKVVAEAIKNAFSKVVKKGS
ncbi:hypothetical protein KO525_05270 [Psychrosphaera sp. B3R10]|uniref:hypothetical protein n=1 Tax=unclassified Psychrosphaera TaxID=2641570 RepID=UPI001C082D80|nr:MULTISPECIES: hypothetical protein [unclassified Psychrosphaera]MBU2881992.1 hypothetical protein [Psychrosphaera sp. I2R16]MBU2988784.1 hypothetical protein [Psychrosphaera sp. B3R10]MDO6721627.1 hypothetical protein [Psychrosphaera sp. 1_MG-2023]